MSELYDFEYYHNNCGPIPYEEPEEWVIFFGAIAERIVKDLNPKTVLDAGCAMGYLVAALRDRGVEAYGLDISDYAISMVREDVKPYCAVGSLVDPLPESFPKKFDLVTNIEVLEHLCEEDGKTAIENLCNITDCIIFSSTPDDYTEKTHVNVQQREYWARLFASAGFYDDLSYRPTYLTYYAVCYRRMADWQQQLENYERNVRIADARYTEAVEELSYYKNNYRATVSQLANVQNAYDVILNSTFWKMSKPMRVAVDFAKRILRSNRYTRLFCKGLKSLKNDGVRNTWKKVVGKLFRRKVFLSLAVRPLYTRKELEAQRAYTFPHSVKLSIVVPLYNTPERFLREMIQSVLDQTYGDWELCMADGSDEEHAYVEQVCQEYAGKDTRVLYQKLEVNKGISENTNACIDMTTGDYIGLLDHDDLLHPAALYDVMRAICEQDADFVYTDEVTFKSPNTKKFITKHFKPDFAIDNLRANNYICHFSVFRKTLLDSAGKFRAEYDGSQDHDMILRLTAQAKTVVHIPKLLYYWRSHPQSVSLDISSKEYAITAGKNAVRDSIRVSGYVAKVSSSRAFPTIYTIRYEIKHYAKVSIIIPTKNHLADLKRCVESILIYSTYDNYEIVIVDNGSEDAEVFSYYDALQKNPKIKVCYLDIEFNYSRLNNFGAKNATGEYYILLNNDTEVITPDWIEELLMYVQRDDVAAAGAMLYYPNETIQHAGIVLGLGEDCIAGHLYFKSERGTIGYMGRLCYAQNMSAVTAACMMVKASAYWEVGGFDEEFQVAYNDVDFCLKLRKAGYLIVWTPYAELYHYESKTRGSEDTPEKQERFTGEVQRFRERWSKELAAGDPYYNPNFALDRGDFSLR